MLVQLIIRNIALIDRLEVTFQQGLNVLTGETGAGKSIVVGSLDFVLGGRADKDRIAGDAARGQVEALFDISALPRAQAELEAMGIECEDGLLPIMREINQNGRSLCRVGGIVTPVSQLRRITSILVDLHGQHAHQSLLNQATHLGFLDAMGSAEHMALVGKTRSTYERWHAAQKALQSAENSALERARQEDMLRYQLSELDGASLSPGEEEELERQRTVMRNAERIREGLERSYAYLSGGVDEETPSALDTLRMALDALSGIARFDEQYEQAHEQVAEALYSLESVSSDLDDLRESVESDPNQLDRVEARMDLLSRFRKKYGATTREMIEYRERVRGELEESENADAKIEALRKEEKALRARLDQDASALSQARHALAEMCQSRVLAELSDLGMANARFEVMFATGAQLSADGIDKVEFLLSANAGQPLRPLSRVASGGELSRIMLAFKCIEAENDSIPVMVFDEIDTGISGRMGQIVAEKMKHVAESRQILCVTHLPQIAAIADAQYLVDKQEEGGKTHTTLVTLDQQGRANVLARMLGGGETALAHAWAMLKNQ